MNAQDIDRLTQARNAVLISNANLLGVLQDLDLLDQEHVEFINAALATGGGLGIESFVGVSLKGIVNVTTVDGKGKRDIIASIPDAGLPVHATLQ